MPRYREDKKNDTTNRFRGFCRIDYVKNGTAPPIPQKGSNMLRPARKGGLPLHDIAGDTCIPTPGGGGQLCAAP